MKKRIISALLLTAVLGAGVSAQAFGGGYPEHPVTNPPLKETENSSMTCWTPSNASYMFTVGGKRFVLLDTDSEGNYFVITEDEYGKYPYSTAYGNNPIVETYVASTGEYGMGAAYDIDDTEWMFSTDNPTSVGYWLNNEFLENGNSSDYILPDEIKAALIEKDWQIEGYKPVIGWTAAQFGGDQSHIKDFVESRYQDGYTVTGKLSLLSYTEYKQYESIIGWTYCSLGWDGFMLRTPYALINGDASSFKYTYGSMQVKNRTANVDTSGMMIIAGNDTPSTANFYVRPVMWLNKDFFKTTPVDLSSAGDIVKEEISKNSMASLSEIYSDDELEILGFNIAGAPKAENVAAAGTPAEGAMLYAQYDYSSPNGTAETDSQIEWFISDTADGEYVSTGVLGSALSIDSLMTGKYIKCRVMPVDAEGNGGKYFWSEPSSVVAAMDIPIVSDVKADGAEANLTVKNVTDSDTSVRIFKVVFDGDNQLVSTTSMDPMPLAAGTEINWNIDISERYGDGSVSVMVWLDNLQPIFYMSF